MPDPLENLGRLPIRPPVPPTPPVGPVGPGEPGEVGPAGKSFLDYFKESIEDANRMQNEAQKAINDLATGRTDNMTEVMTQVEKAGLAFQLLNQIRAKLLQAYTELQNMRI